MKAKKKHEYSLLLIISVCRLASTLPISSSKTSFVDNKNTKLRIFQNTFNSNIENDGGKKKSLETSNKNMNYYSNNKRSDPLASWLWNLKIVIPDQSFHESVFSLQIKNLVCSNFAIDSIQSQTHYSNQSSDSIVSNPYVDVFANGISAKCFGEYASSGIGGKMSAKIQTKSKSSPLYLQLTFTSTDITIPSLDGENNQDGEKLYHVGKTGNVTDCYANIEVPKDGIEFHGSISASIINVFSSEIASFISSELSSQLCLAIKTPMDNLLTDSIGKANAYMVQLIYNQTHDEANIEDDDDIHTNVDKNLDDEKQFISWENNIPLIQKFLQLMNKFLSNHIDKGIIPVSTPSFLEYSSYDVSGSGISSKSTTLPSWALYPTNPQTTKQCEGLLFTGINGFMKRLNNHTNSFNFTFPDESVHINISVPGYGNISSTLLFFVISGVENLEELQLLQPIRERSIRNHIRFNKNQINVSTRVRLIVDSTNVIESNKDDSSQPYKATSLEEVFDIFFNVSNVNIRADAEVKINQSKFDNILVGHLIDMLDSLLSSPEMMVSEFHIPSALSRESYDHSLPPDLWNKMMSIPWLNRDIKNENRGLDCIMSSISSLLFTGISAELNLDGIYFRNINTTPTANNETSDSSLEHELDLVLGNILDLFLHEYHLFVKDALNGLVGGPVKSKVNEFLTEIFPHETLKSNENSNDESNHKKQCDVILPPDGEEFLYFDENKAFLAMESILGQIFGATNANSVMECLSLFGNTKIQTNSTEDVLYKKVIDGFIIMLSNPRLLNMDNFQNISFLQPEIDHYHIKNAIDFDSCSYDNENDSILNSSCKSAYASIEFNIDNKDLGMMNKVDITLSIDKSFSQLGLNTMYNIQNLYTMPVSDFAQRIQCGLIPMSSIEFYDSMLALTLNSIELNLTLTQRESSYFKSMVFEGTDFQHDLSQFLSGKANATQNMWNDYFSDLLEDSRFLCDGDSPPSHQKHHHGARGYFLDILLTWDALVWLSALALASILFFKRRSLRHEHAAEMTVFSNNDELDDKESDKDLLTESLLGDEHNSGGNVETELIPDSTESEAIYSSLFTTQEISPIFRYTIPVCLILTAILFISSNISNGATVEVQFTSPSETYIFPLPLFKFSLVITIEEMFHAGVYILMMVVLIFSGIWPYVKIILMFVAFVAPTNVLTVEKRERMLLWLDALGKYSLVDALILVIIMVAFSFHLNLEETYFIEIFVIPKYGFYSFLSATILSLVLGHLILFIHRQTQLKQDIPCGEQKESLSRHKYAGYNCRSGFYLTKTIQKFIIACLLSNIFLLIIGMNIKSFHFNIRGAAGYILGKNSVESYSLLSLADSLSASVKNPNSFGVKLIQITFYFFAAVMPIVTLLILLCLFCVPMTLLNQRKIFILAEISSAWSAIEVFLLSILSALWQLSEFASFMVGNKCDILDKILKEFGDELGEDTFCFSISASAGWNSIFLVVAGIMSILISSFLLKLGHQALEERMGKVDGINGDTIHYGEISTIERLQKLLPWKIYSIFETENDLNSDRDSSMLDLVQYENDENKTNVIQDKDNSLNTALLGK